MLIGLRPGSRPLWPPLASPRLSAVVLHPHPPPTVAAPTTLHRSQVVLASEQTIVTTPLWLLPRSSANPLGRCAVKLRPLPLTPSVPAALSLHHCCGSPSYWLPLPHGLPALPHHPAYTRPHWVPAYSNSPPHQYRVPSAHYSQHRLYLKGPRLAVSGGPVHDYLLQQLPVCGCRSSRPVSLVIFTVRAFPEPMWHQFAWLAFQ